MFGKRRRKEQGKIPKIPLQACRNLWPHTSLAFRSIHSFAPCFCISSPTGVFRRQGIEALSKMNVWEKKLEARQGKGEKNREIGRKSSRKRAEISGGTVPLKKKLYTHLLLASV